MKPFRTLWGGGAKVQKPCPSTPIMRIGGAEVQPHSFLTWTLYGDMWLNSRPGRFIPAKELRYPPNRRMGGPQTRPERFGKK